MTLTWERFKVKELVEKSRFRIFSSKVKEKLKIAKGVGRILFKYMEDSLA